MLRIPTVYLETTIFNFPFTDDAPHYKEDTLKFFAEIKAGKFRPFTSEYVIGTDANVPRAPGWRDRRGALMS
jgi:hypothetical protein